MRSPRATASTRRRSKTFRNGSRQGGRGGGARPRPPRPPADSAIPVARHTFADALTRLFLGYAMPEGGQPVDAWLPVEGADGSDAELLGRLASFVDDVDAFAERCVVEQTPAEWTQLLLETLAQC